MKVIILLFFITLNTFAQVTFKSEYFAKDKLSRQRLSVQLPLSLQKYEDDPYQRMKIWAISTDACFILTSIFFVLLLGHKDSKK